MTVSRVPRQLLGLQHPLFRSRREGLAIYKAGQSNIEGARDGYTLHVSATDLMVLVSLSFADFQPVCLRVCHASIADVSANLKNTVSKSAAQKILAQLAERDLIAQKSYGSLCLASWPDLV